MKQILYFYGKFCSPCQTFKPTVELISQQYPVSFMDVDEYPQHVAEYGIMSVPTLVFLKDNRVVEKRSGVINQYQIIQIYNSL